MKCSDSLGEEILKDQFQGISVGQVAFRGGQLGFCHRSEAVVIWLFLNKRRPEKGQPVKAVLARETSHFLNATGVLFKNLLTYNLLILLNRAE